jgi:protein phosphatase PTC6
MSDQEISDMAQTAPTPYLAARSIVSFAEDIGGSDNCSAVVVPLAGWAKREGIDSTRERREWRRKEVEGMSSKLVRR